MVVPRPQPGESLRVSVMGSRGQQHSRDRSESIYSIYSQGSAWGQQGWLRIDRCSLSARDLSILTGCEPGSLGKRG